MISTVTYNDNGTKRKVMYEGSRRHDCALR